RPLPQEHDGTRDRRCQRERRLRGSLGRGGGGRIRPWGRALPGARRRSSRRSTGCRGGGGAGDRGAVTIELKGIALHGYHGVLEEERREGQRFLVDVELDLADEDAAASDRIEDAVDYRDVVARVREVSDACAYQLLESFAAALADALIAEF